MKTGINFLLWTTFVGEEQYPLFPVLKEAGFDGVEIPLFEGDAAHYQELSKVIADTGLLCTTSTSLDPETNPVSPDAAIRDAAVERIGWATEMASILGSKVLCGPMHSAWGTFTGVGPTDQEMDWCAGTLRRAGQIAQSRGIELMVEPLNRFECYMVNTAATCRDLLARTEHASVRMLYDTHHAHIEEQDVRGAIVGSGPAVGHVHISENDRGTPGAGLVDWRTTFAALHEIDYDGWLVIESFSRAMPEFAAAVKIWRDFAGSPEEIYENGLRFIRTSWEAR